MTINELIKALPVWAVAMRTTAASAAALLSGRRRNGSVVFSLRL